MPDPAQTTTEQQPKKRRVPRWLWVGSAVLVVTPFCVLLFLSHERKEDEKKEFELIEFNRQLREKLGGGMEFYHINKPSRGYGWYMDVTFNMPGCDINDDDLKILERLNRYKYLRLELTNTAITDRGIKHIKQLDNIHWLRLDGTQVTDDCLEHLAELEYLEELIIVDTNISNSGVQRLQKALPHCNIGH